MLPRNMESLAETYHYCMDHLSDPRTKDWLLIGSPWPTVTLVILYLLAVHYGQRLMAHRAPFDLKEVMVVYNFGLVLLSGYMVYEFARVVWWYYFSKLIEFADTMIFVLRKKTNQITFLHMYHHSSMPLLWWIGTRFAPGGEAFFSATLNSFVHVVMYGYYMLSALGPHVQPYLWWKKYLTSLQLLQFVLILGRVSYTVYTGCEYPRLFQKTLLVYMITLLALFSNFYYQTYIVQKRQHSKKGNSKANGSPAVNGNVVLNGAHKHINKNRKRKED